MVGLLEVSHSFDAECGRAAIAMNLNVALDGIAVYLTSKSVFATVILYPASKVSLYNTEGLWSCREWTLSVNHGWRRQPHGG